jgi:hypothetical protein
MISIHPPLWRQVHGARREASDSTTQLTIRPYHITCPVAKQSYTLLLYVCNFYVASRAFAQESFLTYEHETTMLINILFL